MPTPKELAIRALERTTAQLDEMVRDFPPDRWLESPAGQANNLRGILHHLIECDDWFLMNMAVPEDERPNADPGRCRSAEEMVSMFRAGRAKRLEILQALPDERFDEPSPACRYGNLRSGAELNLCAAEHDFWHIGQIQMLKMAFAPTPQGE